MTIGTFLRSTGGDVTASHVTTKTLPIFTETMGGSYDSWDIFAADWRSCHGLSCGYKNFPNFALGVDVVVSRGPPSGVVLRSWLAVS